MFGLLITLLWRWGTGGLGRENAVPLLLLLSSLQWLRSGSHFLSGQLMWLHPSNPAKPHPALICIVIGCALLGCDLGEVLCHFPLYRQSCRDTQLSPHLPSYRVFFFFFAHFFLLFLHHLHTHTHSQNALLYFQAIRLTNRPRSVRQIHQIFDWNWRLVVPLKLGCNIFLMLNVEFEVLLNCYINIYECRRYKSVTPGSVSSAYALSCCALGD